MSLTAVEVDAGRQTRVIPEPVAGDVNAVGVSAGGAAVAVTIAAPAAGSGKFVFIERIAVSYSAAPAGGRLSISDGTNTIFDVDIAAAGVSEFVVQRRIITKETGATITLAAPGGAIVGKLNVVARLIQ